MFVVGFGAIADPTPPVPTVYHIKLSPIAVNGTLGSFKQYFLSATIGGAGIKPLSMF